MSLVNILFYQLYVLLDLILSYYVDWELFYNFKSSLLGKVALCYLILLFSFVPVVH